MNPHTRHHVRSITVLGWTVGLVSLILAGCSGESPPARPLSGEVTIKGSNTFGEELAPRLIAAYRRQQPNVSVNLESKGSASGIAALLDGTCDIAATSRGATDQELSQAHARGIDLNQYVIGYYGVAVIVSEANPVDRLTEEQVKAIFTGSIRNWREVGGLNLPIHVAIRNPVSGTHRGFRQLAMDNAPYLTEAEIFTTYPQLAQAVAANPGAIGYSSMVMARASGIKALSIGKFPPDEITVNEGWYPYARMLRLYTNVAVETPVARDFVLFVQQNPGQEILSELGFVRRFEKRLKSLTPVD